MESNWPGYFKATQNRLARPLLVECLQYIGEKNNALDLGAGALNDTRHLLEQGFKNVTAVDSELEFLNFCKDLNSDKLSCIVSTFDKFNFPKEEYDIVNAQFALPFNSPETFNEVFTKIKNSLERNGVFVGQFFGVHDDWNKPGSNMTFHTRKEVEILLSDMELIKLDETDKDDKTALGPSKRWHIFHIIARKK